MNNSTARLQAPGTAPGAIQGRSVMIARARAKGTRFGRKAVLDPGQRQKIAERYAAGETLAELAADYRCAEATVWRALR